MKDSAFQFLPSRLTMIEEETENSGFSMPSERKTGSLLRTLISSKPDGHFLELGTGTGLSTAWILSGMNSGSSLDSVDNDKKVLDIARKYLDHDSCVTFHLIDGEKYIKQSCPDSFDLIFADAWPGKYNLLDETLALLKIGGFYVIDDMSPQPNWPEGHKQKAAHLLEILDQKKKLSGCRLNWATGIVIYTRTF
jgi:predicted O-methyltransferase YrrM